MPMSPIRWPAQTPSSMRRAAAALGALGGNKTQDNAYQAAVRSLASMSGADAGALEQWGWKFMFGIPGSGEMNDDVNDINGSDTEAFIKKNAIELVNDFKRATTLSDAQNFWAGAAGGLATSALAFAVRDWITSAYESDAAPRGLTSAIIEMRRILRDNEGGSIREPLDRLFGAVRVVYLILPTLRTVLGREPTNAEIERIASQTNLKKFADIKRAVSDIANELEQKFQGVVDEAKKALATAKQVQTIADTVRKEVNAVLKKLGLPQTPVRGWLEAGQSPATVNRSAGLNVAVTGGMGLRTFGLNGMHQGAHTNLKLAGLGLMKFDFGAESWGGYNVDSRRAAASGRRASSTGSSSGQTAGSLGPNLSQLGSRAAVAVADEAAGNAQLTADKAYSAYLATNASADVPAAKQASALADAALVEIKTHQMAARAANSQAEKAFSAETKAAADAKTAQIAAQTAADKKAADDKKAARDQYLETQKTFYMTLDKEGLKGEYLKIKDGGETDLVALLIEVAKTRGLDLLKKAAPYAAILAAGAIGIFFYVRSKRA